MRLTGKTQGLSPSRLKKLKRALKLAGVDKNVQVLSGRRSMASVKRIYQNELNRKRGYYSGGRKILIEDKSLNDFVKDLNPEIKKKVQHILLRTEYDGPFKENYEVPPVKYSRRGGKAIAKKDLKKLFDKYDVSPDTRKEINNRLFEKLRVDGRTIGSLRDGFGGVESSHVQGDKIDLVLSEVPKPARNALESIGLKLLRERGKNVLDVNFKALDQLEDDFEYSPNVRENVLQSSMAKPKRSIPFKQAFNEARAEGKKEFTWRGNRYNTLKKGEEFQDDQKFDSPEEFGKFKDAVEDEDLEREKEKIMKEVKEPKEEIEAEDIELEQTIPVDQSVPYGVYAQGQPEFEMAEEEQFMAADGGEVETKRFISTLPFKTRRKLANEELDEIGFRRIKKAREKSGNKGFQAARVNPDEIEKIETKYGVFDQMSDQEKQSEMKQNRMFQQGKFDFQEGGEVSDEFNIEDMGSGQDFIDSMEYEMPPLATRPDLRQPEPEGPLVPGVPEVRGFRPPRQPQMEAVDVESRVQEYVEQGQPEESRQQLQMLIDSGVTTREEVGSLVDKYQRPEPEDIVAQGGPEPRDTPPGPMMRRALDVNKPKPKRRSRGATGSFEEEEEVETVKVDQPTVKKRPPVTEEKRRTFRQMFNEAEKQRVKDEADLRKKEDEILAIVEKPIDRKRLYKKMSTVDKVVALLSLAAGEYDAQKFGQPNLYLKRLDKAIEDDVKEQNLDNKQQAIRKAQLLRDAKILSGRLARATKDRDKKEGFLKNENVLDKAYKKQLRGQNEKVRKIKFIETLNRRGLTSREIAFADSVYPDLKVGQKVIKGRDGLFYYTRGDVKKLKEYISDAQDSIDGLAQLEEYVDRVGLLQQIPGAAIFSKDAAGAQSLRDRLVGKLRIEFFGPGVMTDNEREQAKKILGNPNEFFSTDSVEKEKIRNLLLKINYGIRQKLRRDGLAIPESQNDRKVKAWLKREGKSLSDRNKAFAVNALITAEKKHVRLGGKPGKHWVMDEPLPI